jgi:hypothetical protein
LLMVIAYATHTGNYCLCNGKDMPFLSKMNVICDKNSIFPTALLVRISTSITQAKRRFMMRRVLLHRPLDGFKFRNNMIEVPSFKHNLCDGKPLISMECKNSIGIVCVASTSSAWSAFQYSTISLGSRSKIALSSPDTSSLRGARIAHLFRYSLLVPTLTSLIPGYIASIKLFRLNNVLTGHRTNSSSMEGSFFSPRSRSHYRTAWLSRSLCATWGSAARMFVCKQRICK